MDGTYKAKVFCKNCDFRGEIEIPKGQEIKETPCPECGTMNVDKDFNPDLGSTQYHDFS